MLINKILIALTLILGTLIGVMFGDYKKLKSQNKNLTNELMQIKQVRTKEQQTIINLNNRIAEYEQAKNNATQVEQDIINRLNHDNLRLRRAWHNCSVSQTATASSADNGEATDANAIAGAIVRIGFESDIKLKLCQDTIKEYLKLINGN